MRHRVWLVSLVSVAVARSACSGRSGGTGPVCGNGVLEAWEACDGTDFGEQSCLTAVGVAAGQLRCTADCHLDVSGCGQRPECGNGVAEMGEQCDGTDLGGESCESLGYGRGQLGCTGRCVYDVSQCELGPECGNGVVEPGEECDGTDFGEQSCLTAAGLGWGELGCTGDCRLDVSGCRPEPRCGNGVAEEGEACDGEDLAGESCEGLGHGGGELGCTAECELDEGRCWDCGDGLCEVEKGEGQQACPADCRWVDLGVGWSHACGVIADGTVWCWGANEHGQLGDGTYEDRWAPVKVMGLPDGPVDATDCSGGSAVGMEWCEKAGFSGLALGAEHTCVLLLPEGRDYYGDHGGYVMCWGGNEWGQLGAGLGADRSNRPLRVLAVADSDVFFIPDGLQYLLCGPYDCSVVSHPGGVWGRNDTGQLLPNVAAPKFPVLLSNFGVDIYWPNLPAGMGLYTSCYSDYDYVTCFGLNESCLLGDRTSTPNGEVGEGGIDMFGLLGTDDGQPDGIVRPLVTRGFAAVQTERGRVFWWGAWHAPSSDGECSPIELNLPEPPAKHMAVQVEPANRDWGRLAHVLFCYVSGAGNVWCKGPTLHGVRGDGRSWDGWPSASPSQFTQMILPEPARRVGVGRDYFACVLTVSGRVFCTGWNVRGQLGIGDASVTETATPMEVTLPVGGP